MNKDAVTPAAGAVQDTHNLVALLTAISTVSKRMARKIELLERRHAERREKDDAG